MSWAATDDKLHEDPRPDMASLAAMGVHHLVRTWIADKQTDGFVPTTRAVLTARGSKALCKELVTAGLWREVEGGYTDVDYLASNPTRQQAEERRAKRAEAGRLGGQRSSWSRRGDSGTSQPPAPDPARAIGGTLEALAEANAQALASEAAVETSKQVLQPLAQPQYPVPSTPGSQDPPSVVTPARRPRTAAQAAEDRERVLAWCREVGATADYRQANQLCVLDGYPAEAVIAVAEQARQLGATKNPLRYFTRDLKARLERATPMDPSVAAMVDALAHRFAGAAGEEATG